MLTLNPGAPFLPNWHIEAICYQLERIRRGEITRLIINMPPRSLKSILVSVAFPAFLLGHDPRRKIFGISYGTDLAAKHASDFRSIVQSRWYRQAFPNMQIARTADSDVFTTEPRFSQDDVGQRHAHRSRRRLLHHRRSAQAGRCAVRCTAELVSTIGSRTRCCPGSTTRRPASSSWSCNGCICDDLTGHLLENSTDWKVLSLPAIAEDDEEILIGEDRVHVRRAGEALHPEREPLDVLESLRRELGPTSLPRSISSRRSRPAAA